MQNKVQYTIGNPKCKYNFMLENCETIVKFRFKKNEQFLLNSKQLEVKKRKSKGIYFLRNQNYILKQGNTLKNKLVGELVVISKEILVSQKKLNKIKSLKNDANPKPKIQITVLI